MDIELHIAPSCSTQVRSLPEPEQTRRVLVAVNEETTSEEYIKARFKGQ